MQRSESKMANLAESSKEGCGSKGAVLPMMVIKGKVFPLLNYLSIMP
jgi:hypothetical protein